MCTMKTLVTFISRQTWPQLVAIELTKPDHLILMHSLNENESKKPAKKIN